MKRQTDELQKRYQVASVNVFYKKGKCRELGITPDSIVGSYRHPCHWRELRWYYQFTLLPSGLDKLPKNRSTSKECGRAQEHLPALQCTQKGRTQEPVFESVPTKIVSPCSRHPSKFRRGFTDKLNLSLLLTFTELHNWFPELKRSQIHSLLCTNCLHFYGLHFYFIIFNFLLPTLEWVLESQYKTYSGLLF